jgi:hypothetical protein
VKRLGVEYTSSDSSGSEGLGDEAHTLWLLWCVTTLRRSAHVWCVGINFGASVESKEEASHSYMLTRRKVFT